MSWGRTPPTEPGAYWIRRGPSEKPEALEFDGRECWSSFGSEQWELTEELTTWHEVGVEFWSERIEPPRESAVVVR